MLHLENFFEKSFALLLTTPSKQEKKKIKLFKEKNYDTINQRNKGKGISEHESTKEKHAGLSADLD